MGIVEINARNWVDRDVIGYTREMVSLGFRVRLINVDPLFEAIYSKELEKMGLRKVVESSTFERKPLGDNPPTCPNCGEVMELAHYLEGEEGFESAFICMSCPDPHYTPLD